MQETVQMGRQAGRAPAPVKPVRPAAGFRLWPAALFAASFAVSWVPVFGGMLSHPIDRLKSSSDAKHELKIRAKYYSQQIGTTLGMSPDRVGANDLLKAASINPALRHVVDEVHKKKANEDRSSLFINGGVTIASMAGAGGLAKLGGEAITAARTGKAGLQAAKQIAGSLAGGAVAGVLSKSELDAQALIEATDSDIQRARSEGLNASAAINPQMTFMIRVSQDEALKNQINKMAKDRFGKKFHQLDSQQLGMVMNQYPDLANATLREAHAIVNGDMNIRDLAATAPNMGSGFAGPMARSDNAPRASFVDRENARRAAATQQGVSA